MGARGVRDRQAGVSLVEVLVVLVLIGVMAGVIGLGLGPADRGGAAASEAQLLTTRLNRAADEVMQTGAPVAFVWTETGYRFLALAEGEWAAHPVALLGTPHELEAGLRLEGEGGEYVVLASLRPAQGAALRLSLGEGGGSQDIVFDGAMAMLAEEGN